MKIEPIESMFEMPVLDTSFFDGKPGLDVETKAMLQALFCEENSAMVPDYYGNFPGDEE